MIFYIIRRIIYMIILLFIASVISFVIIQLPPGDFVESYIQAQIASGRGPADREAYELALRKQYGLTQPIYVQYAKWMWRGLHGKLGYSLTWRKSVTEMIVERLPLTVLISFFTLIFVYLVAIPIGIYSATHQYSPGDYAFTVAGFVGLAIPNFFLALILMYLFFTSFGMDVGGLFSVEYETAVWSVARFIDMLKHLPIPLIVMGTAGTAAVIRIMRGCLLDELRKQYVITARAKGVKESKILFKYPVRMAINPIVSNIGQVLPAIVSGEAITSIVLGLPTTGPLLYGALLDQDMYLAGSIVMLLTFLTIIGMFLSDILLVWIDPRIRFE